MHRSVQATKSNFHFVSILAAPVDNTGKTINCFFFFFNFSLSLFCDRTCRRHVDMRKNTALFKNVIVLGYLS